MDDIFYRVKKRIMVSEELATSSQEAYSRYLSPKFLFELIKFCSQNRNFRSHVFFLGKVRVIDHLNLYGEIIKKNLSTTETMNFP